MRFPGGLARRTTSTSLSILEVAPALLNVPIPDASPSSSGSVSLLRGFQATVPSASTGKERRRKVRGTLADSGMGDGVGVKKIAAGEGGNDDKVEVVSSKERRRRKRESMAASGPRGKEMSAGELTRMQDEIKWDRDNLVVRKVRSSSPDLLRLATL